MDPRAKYTLAATILIAGLILLWDWYLHTDGISGNTISEVVRYIGQRAAWFPYALAFATGGLLYHFFRMPGPLWFPLLVAMALGMAAAKAMRL